MGSVWRRLGAQTTVLEALPAFLGAADEAVAKEAKQVFAKQGLAIQTGVAITKVDVSARRTSSSTTPTPPARRSSATFDQLIVSIGRVPHTGGPRRATRSASTLDERGFVAVDGECRTNLPQRLGDRRRRARADARAQGRGGGRRGRRAHRRPARPRRLQHGALGHLHVARDRVGRQDRAAAEGRGRRVSRRQLPVRGQRPRARAGRHHRLREDPRRRARPTASSACTSSARWRPS